MARELKSCRIPFRREDCAIQIRVGIRESGFAHVTDVITNTQKTGFMYVKFRKI